MIGIAIGLIFLGSFIWLVKLMKNAPEGYEDNEGFHQCEIPPAAQDEADEDGGILQEAR